MVIKCPLLRGSVKQYAHDLPINDALTFQTNGENTRTDMENGHNYQVTMCQTVECGDSNNFLFCSNKERNMEQDKYILTYVTGTYVSQIYLNTRGKEGERAFTL